MPTIQIPFIGDEYQTFVVDSPQTGTIRVINNGTDSLYIFDPAVNSDWKVQPGQTVDLQVVRHTDYGVKVCGTVSVTWSFL